MKGTNQAVARDHTSTTGHEKIAREAAEELGWNGQDVVLESTGRVYIGSPHGSLYLGRVTGEGVLVNDQPQTRDYYGELLRFRFRDDYSTRHTDPEARARARHWIERLRNFRDGPAETSALAQATVAQMNAGTNWRAALSLGNLMRFGAFWVVLAAILRLLLG